MFFAPFFTNLQYTRARAITMGDTAATARTLATILILSLISSIAVADDAGSGSDAGGTASSSTSLSATNSTYSGNLSATDTSDFYSISMPNGTGVSVGLTLLRVPISIFTCTTRGTRK